MDRRTLERLKRVVLPTARLVDPTATVEVGASGPLLAVRAGGHQYELPLIWAGDGFPQDVKRALGPAPHPRAMPAVLTARRLSPGARALAEAHGMSWLDGTGAARVLAPPALALVTRSSPQARPDPTFHWSSSAGAVAELLLTFQTRGLLDQGQVPPLASLTANLPYSRAQISNVLNGFDKEGWTEKTGATRGPSARRELRDPGELLSAWTSWQLTRQSPQESFHAMWDDAAVFVSEVVVPALDGRSWCMSGLLAAEHLAPFLSRTPSLQLYIDTDAYDDGIAALERTGQVTRTRTGARLHVLPAEPHVVALALPGPIPLASEVRIYADLLSVEGRAEQAAEHLREVCLGF